MCSGQKSRGIMVVFCTNVIRHGHAPGMELDKCVKASVQRGL